MVFEYEQSFFHGAVGRSDVEALLYNQADGSYLIRTSSSGDGYALSMFYRAEGVMHFQLKNQGECWFCIDDGPMYEGIQGLISHYAALSDGLPVPLTKCVAPPRRGKPADGNNKLHAACAKGDRAGFLKYVSKFGYQCRNAAGRTPLHEACRNDQPAIVEEILGRVAYTDVGLEMADNDGWTPMHMAAAAGASNCLKLLIVHKGDFRRRSNANELPRMLAARFGHTECSKLLTDAESGRTTLDAIESMSMPWYHGRLNRAAAEHVLSVHGLSDGLFLVRDSSSVSGDFVLTMAFDGAAFHFQITKLDGNTFCIDDGPGVAGLSNIIEYYTTTADGLPCALKLYAKRASRTSMPAHTKSSKPAQVEEDIYETAVVKKSAAAVTPVAPARKPPANPAQASAKSDYNRLSKSDLPPEPVSERSPYVIQQQDVILGQQLGAGEFGAVYRGQWRNGSQLIEVAVKTMREDLAGTGADKEFLREANLMVTLQHRNVVQLLGISIMPQLMIIQELMPLGALQDHLEKHQKKLRDSQLIKWAAEVANGMSYLEKKKFVHRDLATRNILLNGQAEAKISDFGLSRVYEETYYKASKGGKWPIKWYAPESIYYGKFTSRSDVWSFGVTLWEIWSYADMPYGDMMGSEVISMLERGERLQCPRGCPQAVYDLMQKCWAFDADNRPSFFQLMHKLTNMMRQL